MLGMQDVRKKFAETMSGISKPSSITIVRRAVNNQVSIALGPLGAAIDDIVKNQLWSTAKTPKGLPFESFAPFALALAPHGLGVASQSAARLVRQGLLDNKHFREWTEMLKVMARKQGNPGNIANRDVSRFYTIGRSKTCRDRLLLALEGKYPAHFARVCSGEWSPRQAAIEAGLILRKPVDYVGVRAIVQSARCMNKRAQGKLLRILFEQLSLDAQCALIANSIEVKLGMQGLAKRWRSAASQTSAGSSAQQQ